MERIVLAPAPAHHQRLDQGLQLGSGVKESGAFGRREPLVAATGVEIGAQRTQVERKKLSKVMSLLPDHFFQLTMIRPRIHTSMPNRLTGDSLSLKNKSPMGTKRRVPEALTKMAAMLMFQPAR